MPYLRRREILRGIGLYAGAPLLGALCRNMTPDALGQTLIRKRILFYVMDGGMGEDCYAYNQPRTTSESFVPRGNPDGTINLGSGWAPLEPYRNEMIFLANTYHPFNVFNHGGHYFLSAMQIPGVPPEKFAPNTVPGPPPGISLDRLIGKAIGENDLHRSIAVGGSGWSGSQTSDGPNQAAPSYSDPVKAYATYFGGGLPMPGDTAGVAAYLAERKSLFDFLRGDLDRLKARLAAPERAKMEQYVDSIRRVETRLTALADPTKLATCKTSPPPSIDSRLTYGERVPQIAAAIIDIGASALVCGLTKVVLVRAGWSGLTFLGDSRIGTHTMQHGTSGSEAPFAIPINEMHKRCYNWHATNVKTIRERLGAAREGNGTIMDSSMIALWNATGTWHHYGPINQYAWIIGSAGGYFKNMNRYKKYPQLTHSMSDVFVSVAKAMGVTPRNAAGTADRFGDELGPGKEFTRPNVLNRVLPTVANTGPNPDLT